MDIYKEGYYILYQDKHIIQYKVTWYCITNY